MLATVGDLIQDVIVSPGDWLVVTDRSDRHGRLNLGADTAAEIVHRRGGSAANVAAVAARVAGRSRFIGQLGSDSVGWRLTAELEADGVEVVGVRQGRTGTVLVFLHPDGERSMITDRGDAGALTEPRRDWLDGVSVLHVPLYSLAEEPLASTVTTLARWAREGEVELSIDLSATSLLDGLGPDRVRSLLAGLAPSVVLANRDELARLTDARSAPLAPVVIEKRGPDPARLVRGDEPVAEVPAVDLGPVGDTTGAGDAFAAGFWTARIAGAELVSAVGSGHAVAAERLRDLRSG